MRVHLLDLATGETQFAAAQRADLLRQALLTLNDDELMVITLRSTGATLRETAIHAGCCHVSVMRVEKRAMKKLREWFSDHGVFEVTDIL